MSAIVARILTCDGTDDEEVCPSEFDGDGDVQSLAALRRAARQSGWRRKRGNRDLCPQCVQEGEQ